MASSKFNLNNPGVKRILSELREMEVHADSDFNASPLEDNLFEWHFTIKGPEDSPFAGGIYHGRILLPVDYPFKPPNIVILTPNGRFEVGTKICLSISGHHPETWQPSWSIRTALIALRAFMPTPGDGALGSLDLSPDDQRSLAKESVGWSCEKCGCNNSSFDAKQRDTDHNVDETKPSSESSPPPSSTAQAASPLPSPSPSPSPSPATNTAVTSTSRSVNTNTAPPSATPSPRAAASSSTRNSQSRAATPATPTTTTSGFNVKNILDLSLVVVFAAIVALVLRKL